MQRNLLISILLFLIWIHAGAQIKQPFPRSNPETEGVSSKGILDFINAANKSNNELHSFMFVRHGKVIAEGWWKPYRPDLKHTMYSVSKSFTATAVGFAVSEKRLSVNDQVIDFFPEYLPDTISPFLRTLTVKDLLTMAAGQEPDPTGAVIVSDSNWVKGFLATPILHQPGSRFLYNSLATYMLSAIVQKLTGQKIIDYLKPRLFVPLGMENLDWETDLMGINSGGWGLRIRTEDLAKFGQLFLQKGNWKGKQILPEQWIEEATTLKIEQRPELSQAEKDNSDWLQGYCYQMWRCRNNAYRGDGAFGQYIIVFPEQDAVVAITSETANMQDELNLVWQYLLPSLKHKRLPADPKTQSQLKQKLSTLALKPPARKTDTAYARTVSQKVYTLSSNERQMQNISFSFRNNICDVTIMTDTGRYSLQFGSGNWKTGATSRKGPSLVGRAKGHFKGLPPAKIAASYTWKDQQTLELVLRYIESPHTEILTCRFHENSIEIETQISFERDKKYPVITGMAQ